jgi:hypothetical protein
MSATTDKRITNIRAKTREERALLSKLNNRIGADLKKALKPASFQLDDVEEFFLAPEVLRNPPRSESEMAKWLRKAETILDRAIKHREWIEGLVRKHGPDARIVGGQDNK